MSQIRVALVGAGNCASALVQGIQYYKSAENEKEALGLKNLVLGGYRPKDVKFTVAFDINSSKVGKDLSNAIFESPNNTSRFCDVPFLDVPVLKGPILDGIAEPIRNLVKIDKKTEINVARQLKNTGTEIVLNLLPSGARNASLRYAEEAIKAGCAFVNVTPTSIASDEIISDRFRKAKLPITGDDLVDQVGATFLHKIILSSLSNRGLRVSQTYQLDVGGGTESFDTLERSRDLKQRVKTKSVKAAVPYETSIVAGSTDYVEFLENRRDSYFWIEGKYFGNTPMHIDMRLSTIDAPNAGSILLDVIRAMKIAIDRGLAGSITNISAYAFKNILTSLSPELAEKRFVEFIKGDAIRKDP